MSLNMDHHLPPPEKHAGSDRPADELHHVGMNVDVSYTTYLYEQ